MRGPVIGMAFPSANFSSFGGPLVNFRGRLGTFCVLRGGFRVFVAGAKLRHLAQTAAPLGWARHEVLYETLVLDT